MTTTNIDELLKHLKQVYGSLFRTKEFERYAAKAGDKIQEEVLQALKSNKAGYNYRQSSALRRTLSTQTADYITGRSSMKIGFGYIDDLNRSTKRGAQRAIFPGIPEPIRLKPERELPSWVIMEFGRKGTANRPSAVPSFIKKEISYSPREPKSLLFGPSESYHFSKPVFFMTNKEALKSHGQSIKGAQKHPGIREGRFFRDGLKQAIPQIQLILGEGIEASLQSLKNR